MYILYEGPSQLDGAPIVVILTGTPKLGKRGQPLATKASRNSKTAAMLQTWIIRSDIAPHHAVKSGADSSICGNCGHRPELAKLSGAAACYVKTFQAPLSVYLAYKRGRYQPLPIADIAAKVTGHRTRIGSYGDPAAAPIAIWQAIAGAAEGITGYSHQWRDGRFADYRDFLMASVDNAGEALDAMARGWRYFRVAAKGDAAKLGREVSCPASKEAGARTTCAACRACGGLAARAKASIVIQAH